MNGSSLLPLQSQLFIPNASFTHTSTSLHFLSQRSISKPQKHADCSRKGHLLSYSWAYDGWMDEFRNSWNFSKVSSSSTQFCSTAALNKVSMIRKKIFSGGYNQAAVIPFYQFPVSFSCRPFCSDLLHKKSVFDCEHWRNEAQHESSALLGVYFWLKLPLKHSKSRCDPRQPITVCQCQGDCG